MFQKITAFAFVATVTLMTSSVAQAGCKVIYKPW